MEQELLTLLEHPLCSLWSCVDYRLPVLFWPLDCSSNYCFRLHIWYLQTFLKNLFPHIFQICKSNVQKLHIGALFGNLCFLVWNINPSIVYYRLKLVCFIAPKTLIIWFFNLSILSVPGESYSRNASCALNLISTFLRVVRTKFYIYVFIINPATFY